MQGGLQVVKVGSRHNFATQHLWNARHTARLCREREDHLLTVNAYQPDIELTSLVVSSVLAATAFLEALVNEVWQDAADTEPGETNQRLTGLSDDAVARMRELWLGDNFERSLQPLDKYRVALTCADQPPIDKGHDPYQSVQTAIQLRNALMHFKPKLQWHDEQHELEKRLKHKFQENRLPLGDPWYPNKALGSGCAEWAWTRCQELADQWWQQMGLERAYREEDFEHWPEP
jgi:hypothetical protein